MTKTLKTLIVTLILFISVSVYAKDEQRKIEPIAIDWYNAVNGSKLTFIKNESAYSQRFDLRQATGYFSLQMALSQSKITYGTGERGKLNVEYHISNDGITYMSPTSASRIFTNVDALSRTHARRNLYTPQYIHTGATGVMSPTTYITKTSNLMSDTVGAGLGAYLKIFIKGLGSANTEGVSPTATIAIQ